MAMTSENPKLLHELDWAPQSKLRWHRHVGPEWIRGANVCGYAILEDECGRYSFIHDDDDSMPRWIDLDPITAQAVLIHLQQTNPHRPEG
jgi:hypothetical protein